MIRAKEFWLQEETSHQNRLEKQITPITCHNQDNNEVKKQPSQVKK